jgi:hypothetical protein
MTSKETVRVCTSPTDFALRSTRITTAVSLVNTALSCHVPLEHAVSCYTVLCHAVPCYTVLCHAVRLTP